MTFVKEKTLPEPIRLPAGCLVRRPRWTLAGSPFEFRRMCFSFQRARIDVLVPFPLG